MYTKKLLMSFTEEFYKDLQEKAAEKGLKVTHYIRMVLTEKMKEEK